MNHTKLKTDFGIFKKIFISDKLWQSYSFHRALKKLLFPIRFEKACIFAKSFDKVSRKLTKVVPYLEIMRIFSNFLEIYCCYFYYLKSFWKRFNWFKTSNSFFAQNSSKIFDTSQMPFSSMWNVNDHSDMNFHTWKHSRPLDSKKKTAKFKLTSSNSALFYRNFETVQNSANTLHWKCQRL